MLYLLWIAIGCGCYLLTDVSGFLRWLSTKLVVVPYGTLRQAATALAIFAWPVWLAVYWGVPWRDRD